MNMLVRPYALSLAHKSYIILYNNKNIQYIVANRMSTKKREVFYLNINNETNEKNRAPFFIQHSQLYCVEGFL